MQCLQKPEKRFDTCEVKAQHCECYKLVVNKHWNA